MLWVPLQPRKDGREINEGGGPPDARLTPLGCPCTLPVFTACKVPLWGLSPAQGSPCMLLDSSVLNWVICVHSRQRPDEAF